MAGNNPNFYAYTFDSNTLVDPFGLWGTLNWDGLGHHLMPRAIAKKLNISNLTGKNALAWFPNDPSAYTNLHLDMHKLLQDVDIPWHGSKFSGKLVDFMKAAKEAYKDIDIKGVLKFPGKNGRIVQKNLTPLEALEEIEKMIKNKNIPCK